MEDVRFGRPFGGGQITRQLSSSHVTPRSISGYQDFFRMSSSREEGWLETKIGRAEKWERKWVVFDDGVLYYSTDKDADRDDDDMVTRVPMDRVISLRTDDQYGDSTIQIVTTEHKLYIRAPSKDEMRRWLFCFQKSVALVLSKLLLSSSQSFPSTKAAVAHYNQNQLPSESLQQQSFQMQYTGSVGLGVGYSTGLNDTYPSGGGGGLNAALKVSSERILSMDGETDSRTDSSGDATHRDRTDRIDRLGDDNKMWLAELGHGHGKHRTMAKRRITFNEGISQSLNPSRSTSMFISDDDDGDRSSNTSSRLPFPVNDTQSSQSEATRRSVWDRSYAERSVVDLTRMSLQEPELIRYNDNNNSNNNHNSSSGNMNNRSNDNMSRSLLGKSPMIPIVELSMSRSLFESKLAGSYQDSLNRERVMVGLSLSPPEGERCGSLSEGSRSSDQSYPHDFDDEDGLWSPDSDGDMMFDFDDMDINNSKTTSATSNRKGRESRSRGDSNLSNSNHSNKDTNNNNNNKDNSNHNNNKDNNKNARRMKVQPAVELPGLRWSSGFCTKLGPRSSNEDRLVAHPNLVEAVINAKRERDGREERRECRGLSITSMSSNYNNSSQASISASLLVTGIGVDEREGREGRENEDNRHSTQRQGYFAVYDGHCGAQAASHLQESLHLTIFNHPLYHTDIQTAIIESCIATDKAFLAESRERKQYSGTTALGAIVRGSEVVVFNIGDCHAVMCVSGVAMDLSDPHKPNRPDEAARILAAKGWITEEKELYMARLHRMDLSDPVVRDKAQHVSWVTIHRVCGEISVSRSIGDPDYKSFQPGEKVDAFFIWPEGHDQVFMADLLIPVPECRTFTLQPGHEFLIIASDGLWDVVSGAEAVTRAKTAFELGKTASEAAEELCELALKLGSSDNVTVVIVQFIHS